MSGNGSERRVRPVLERLRFDAQEDLKRLIAAFRDGRVVFSYAGLDAHFAVARAKPPEFRDHETVLAMSMGGSNTKVMLAHMRGGDFVVERARVMPNPAAPAPMDSYFDELLLGDEGNRAYLHNAPRPRIGVSIAVQIVEGVPYHKTKIRTIDGLVMRSLEGDRSRYHFGRNMGRYLSTRGLRAIPVVYQGDGIVAHLGGVASAPLAAGHKSVLLVCGNGLACGDERHFVLVGMPEILQDKPDLYPHAAMENGQYQYLVAGKGLHGLMDRAIRLRAQEAGSALAGFDLSRFFATDMQSRNVAFVWESGLSKKPLRGEVAETRELVGSRAFDELRALATAIMERGISVLANCTVSTIVHMGRAESGRGHVVFFEGSVALDPFVKPRVVEEIRRIVAAEDVYAATGTLQPLQPVFDYPMSSVLPGPGVSTEEASRVELTLRGCAVMAVADSLIGREGTPETQTVAQAAAARRGGRAEKKGSPKEGDA